MRRRIRLDSTFIAALSVLTFIGCESANNTTSDNRPTVTAENFTTQGKPTKTIQTPWGDKQLYDPTQDPEIIEAFEYVKNIHKQYGPNEKYDELKRYDILFSQIRNIQYLDMGRLGCQDIRRPNCNDIFDNFSKNSIPQNCLKPSFGSPILDTCEVDHTTLISEYEDHLLPLSEANEVSVCSSAVFGTIGSNLRGELLGSIEESASEYFQLSCNSYESRIDDGDRERTPQ